MTLPNQRWQIFSPQPHLAEFIATSTGLSTMLAQVLINRGMDTVELAQRFLEPDSELLPDPKDEFQDLIPSLDRIEKAIRSQESIAICGDYDVDGMASTALLIRTFRALGAQADYAIPSRMTEGYGINDRIVRELNGKGVTLLITVDNGIAAYDAIALAESLGTSVIVTDHHDIPIELPPATAILNPKYKVNPSSPYATIAGVGVAYVLALELADRFGKRAELADPLLELFTLGTIADLASLTGINRRLVQKGLRLLAQSKLLGVTALINESGIVKEKQTGLKPEAIGFGLGPRINAVGRIGDPRTVIDLLTAEEMGQAIVLAQECEATNRERQVKCAEIEQEAIAYISAKIQSKELDLKQERVLVVVDREVKKFLADRAKPKGTKKNTKTEPLSAEAGWHHGVIGIVASRLVERYGAPVFIGSVEDETLEIGEDSELNQEENHSKTRFSVRGIPEFHVFKSLEFIKSIRDKGGGHKAAGGFSISTANLDLLRQALREFADREAVTAEHIQPLIEVDVLADLGHISMTLLQEIDRLQPCGIGNSDPVFYSRDVRVLAQQRRGKEKTKHLALELDKGNGEKIKAIAWRWGEYCPIPDLVDLAYKLRANQWQDTTSVELEVIGIRAASQDASQDNDYAVNSTPMEFARKDWQPILDYKSAPNLEVVPKWQTLAEASKPLARPILLYGYDRPANLFKGDVDCDRPRRRYTSLVLWSLPPSVTHLRWLIALAQPEFICVGQQIPKIPTDEELLSQVELLVGSDRLNLLDLAQQWWVAPCTIVAALRQLGYSCPNFPSTYALDDELQRLQKWYNCSLEKLSNICKS
ncbi:single-stranded-DNA-specific exonuclease RecJ [Tumidithrix helvetica PCC 7403]|uniref:single-stranded-DNA-specific exonuclease RecJ n=1 Tax=Tumidithrix helvetica TaxID=3457545 RepID=UPI003CBC765A